jgi:hypothetical protein
MRNLLIQLEKSGIPHFIVKSHIYAAFDDSEYRSEYHIYHWSHPEVGKWNFRDPNYEKMRFKIFSKEELRYFRSNIDKYTLVKYGKNGKVLNPKDGKIWVNEKVGFNPNYVKKKQRIDGDSLYKTPDLFSHI